MMETRCVWLRSQRPLIRQYSWPHFHPRLSGADSEVYTQPTLLMKRHVLFKGYSDLLDC